MGEELIADSTHHDGVRVAEWEVGLPTADDLPPLSVPLIPPNLAFAFKISPEQPYTSLELNRACEDTLSSLRRRSSDPCTGLDEQRGSGPNNSDRKDGPEEEEKTTVKRARLVWTPQLHKLFVEVVAHLGFKDAVPKSIMQLMNVEGLTRENVASHLQKYRLYVKRVQGLSTSESSSIDNGGGGGDNLMELSIPMPYPPPSSLLPTMGMDESDRMPMMLTNLIRIIKYLVRVFECKNKKFRGKFR